MTITLTGASGFLGRALLERLRAAGHDVRPVRLRDRQALPASDAVIHLAGEPVGQRWTEEAKRRIRESRVAGTRDLIGEVRKLPKPPRVFVCASAVGIYGDREDEPLTESSPPGTGFLAEVCTEWEQAADEAALLGARVVKLRLGLVLGRGGGALARMLPVFKLGGGGRLGSGRQWMSWIHIQDVAGLVEFALNHDSVRGPVNATTPNPVTNDRFTAELARALGRPALVPAPAWGLRLAFGEMASMLLEGQRVLPRAALDAGYAFRYSELAEALAGIVDA